MRCYIGVMLASFIVGAGSRARSRRAAIRGLG
jgi:hypothetical protein